MTGSEAAYYSLFVGGGIFVLLSLFSSGPIKTVKDFFHHDNPKKNAISLILANITLGTGLVYLSTLGELHGGLALLVPLAMGAGYYLFASELGRLGRARIPVGKNIILATQEKLFQIANRPVHLMIPLTICLVFSYSLVLGYEIAVSAGFLSNLISLPGIDNPELFFSIYLFVISMLTVLFGGIRGVHVTDIFQAVAMVLVIGLICFATVDHSVGIDSSAHQQNFFRISGPTIFTIGIAVIYSLLTPFLSILSWGYASHLKPKDQPKTFRWAGIGSTAVLLLIVGCGAVASQYNFSLMQVLSDLYTNISGNSTFWTWVICITVIIGLTAVVCATIDSLVLTITQFCYDNILKGDSTRDSTSNRHLSRIRWGIVFIAVIGYIAVEGIRKYNLDLYQLLLMLASGAMVLAPFLWLIARLWTVRDGLKLISNKVISIYLGLFSLTYIIELAMVGKYPKHIQYVSLISILLSIFVSSVIYRNSIKLKKV